MASSCAQQLVFFPKTDAAVLSCRLAPPTNFPETVGPVYDPEHADTPIVAWSAEVAKAHFPSQDQPYAPSPIPEKQRCLSDRYLRATLAENERFRLSMLWYYTRDILKETEFILGLQEKVGIAQETIGWDFAIVGILDVNFYTRLAAIGVPLGILPRGETLCAHTVVQPPGNVFHLPNMLEDWRFADSPYVESGGLRAYAGAPLRLQNESGETACLGSLCVASSTSEQPLTKAQQTTLVRLADWIVSDIVQLTRARRQRDRRRMADLIAAMQSKRDDAPPEKSVVQAMQTIYPGALIGLHSSKVECIEVEGRDAVALSDLSNGLWEDANYFEELIAKSNHLNLPTNRVVRIIASRCESVSGRSILTVATKDVRLVFDDIDAWFVQTCADIISQTWQKHILAEVMLAKEKFLRGFSHQLRTPLHGILGSVELMSEELKALGVDDPVPKATALLQAASGRPGTSHEVYLNTIKRAGRDLISIINSMITLNRWSDVAIRDRQHATHTTYELETALANEMLKLVSGDTRYNACIIFSHRLPPDQCSLRTDLGLLRDSLLPVIINAIQSTVEGTVAVTITPRPDLKELIVDVEDTGRGIPLGDQERIFELYEQVDTHSTGAGLGLTLASKFAALLDGSVDLVRSEIDCGSHFRVTFQNMELVYPELPLVPKLANLPGRYHTVPSKTGGMTLCNEFAKFLACYGLINSDDIKDALIILDLEGDCEQHRATVLRFPSDQVMICLAPSQEVEAHYDNTFKNVIYVHSPFLTSTMVAALEHADQLALSFKSDQSDQVETKGDLLTESKLETPVNGDHLATVQRADIEVSKVTDTDSPLVGSEVAKVDRACVDPCVPESPQNSCIERRNPAKDEFSIEEAVPMTIQLSSRSAKDDLIRSDSPTSAPAMIEDEVALLELHSPDFTWASYDRATTSHPTTLIVDDNVVNLRVMQMYCEKRKLSYVCARDGLEAVAAFEKHQVLSTTQTTTPPIRFILMDLQMPHCNGIEATKRIRQLEKMNNWDESVLFMVTGQDSPADREAANAAGSQEYYVKPVGMKSWDAGVKRYFPCFEASTMPW